MIEVGRNSIVIRNGKKEDAANLKRFNANFSLYDKVTHKYTFSVYQTIKDDIYIPTSVGVSSIQSYFPDHDISENYKATAKTERMEYIMKHQPRDDLQKKAISFLLNLKKDTKMKSAFLSLATGSGKTYVTINFISQIKKKPIIIVDTIELANQWKREFQNHSNLIDSDIVILSGSEIVEKEQKAPTGKVYIAIHRTLGNMLSEDPNSVNVLMNKLKIRNSCF